MKKYFIYFLVLLALNACSSKEPKNSTTNIENSTISSNLVQLDKDQIQQANLKMAVLEKGTASMEVHLNGKIDVPPTAVASVSIPMGGYVQDINLIPGNYVKKGSTIATIKDPQFVQLQEDYLSAKAKSVYLSQDMDRQKLLLQQDAVSKKTFQLLQSEFNTNAIALKGLAEKLKLINIDPSTLSIDKISSKVNLIAPISGYVSKVNINRGKYVAPTEVLLELIDPNDVHAAITIYEKDITLFKEGMKGKVVLANEPNKSYSVSVLAVSKNLDDDKSGLLHCHFTSVPKNMLPGMFLTADFSVNNANTVIVPINAIQRFQGVDYIFIQQSANQFEAKQVTVGTINKTTAAILNPEATEWLGKNIVVENAYSLLGKLMNKSE
ncbi:MAG: efflux RND transporter periplasmic adaptor subunit [Sediminibacterium sp.]|jgi:cobalt-zinc-cadmium efflux system membrane fusion protein